MTTQNGSISRSEIRKAKMASVILSSHGLQSLRDYLCLRVIPRSPQARDDDPSPEGFGPQGEESRTALKTLRARFLAPLGMTARAGFSHRLCRPPPVRLKPSSPLRKLALSLPKGGGPRHQNTLDSRFRGLSPCLLEPYGRQAEGFRPAFRSVRAGRPQGRNDVTFDITNLVRASIFIDNPNESNFEIRKTKIQARRDFRISIFEFRHL